MNAFRADKKCPIAGCKNEKKNFQLVCRSHWSSVPAATQNKLYELYNDNPGSQEHRQLCFSILKSLNSKALGK